MKIFLLIRICTLIIITSLILIPIPTSTLQFWINNSCIRFNTQSNKTIRNTSYNKNIDVYSWFANGTGGYLNTIVTMNKTETNYNFKIDNVISQIKITDINYAKEDDATEIANGFRGLWKKEAGIGDRFGLLLHRRGEIKNPLSGFSPKSFWVTLSSLRAVLNQYGFINIKIIEDNPNHPNGSRVTLAAGYRINI